MLIVSIFGILALSMSIATTSAANSTATYSTFHCIGASQVLDTNSMKQAAMQKFPMNDPEHRTCLFRNVCINKGELNFYISSTKHDSLSQMKDYIPDGFDGGKMLHTGHLRGFTMPIKTVVGAMPSDSEFHHSKIAFLDANSWSFNYGHYFIDNVIPAFTAARLFNIPFTGTLQIIETNCKLFSILEEGFSARLIDYNHSLGTYREGCLSRFDGMWANFFDNAPLYIDQMKERNRDICFKRMFAGQGSTFGLKSIDLTRGIILREFRDYVLGRLPFELPKQENIILVGLRVQGSPYPTPNSNPNL